MTESNGSGLVGLLGEGSSGLSGSSGRRTTRTAFAIIGLIAFGLVAILAAGGAGMGITALIQNASQSDDIDDIQSIASRQSVPDFEDAVGNFNGFPVPRPADDDDSRHWANRNGQSTGYTVIHPKYDDSDNPAGGGFDSLVDSRFHVGAYAYGHMTANCTNSEEAAIVWSSSAAIEEGDVVGSRKGKAVKGFADYEYVVVDSDNIYPEAAALMAFGNDSALVFGMDTASTFFTSSVVGTSDDSDGLTTAPGVGVGTAYAGAAVSSCMFAGSQHTDMRHYVVAVNDPTGADGGVADLCIINSMSPFSNTCATVPAAFAAGETIKVVSVNHIENSENFLITYMSEASGLSSVVATVNRVTLAISVGAPTVIDAAMDIAVCGHAQVIQSGSVFTYLYMGDSVATPFGLTSKRYTLTGTTLTNVVGSTTHGTSYLGSSFHAASIGPNHFVVALVAIDVNVAGELQLYSALGTVAPSLIWRGSFIDPSGPAPPGGIVTAEIVDISDNAVIVSYDAPEFGGKPVAQVWHMHTDGSGTYLVPGQDRPIDVVSSETVPCVRIATGDRAFCLNSGNSASSLNHQVRVSKLKTYTESNPTFAQALSTVFTTADQPMGIALTDAPPGGAVLLRTQGCFETPDNESRYLNKRALCLHGDGQVTPNTHVPDNTRYEPRCQCFATGANSFKCSLIGV